MKNQEVCYLSPSGADKCQSGLGHSQQEVSCGAGSQFPTTTKKSEFFR